MDGDRGAGETSIGGTDIFQTFEITQERSFSQSIEDDQQTPYFWFMQRLLEGVEHRSYFKIISFGSKTIRFWDN
ncbi:MAG: hypothetical protein WAN11_19285 [Syntrophobacteraceae bacterium]